MHTHTSLLTRGPAVRAPQTSGGGLILSCLRCPFFPQGYCVKSRDAQSRGCSSKGQVTQAPSPSGYAHPCSHTCTHTESRRPPTPITGTLVSTQASAQEEWPADVRWRDRGRLAAHRSGGGWRDEDLGRGPEQPLDQTQMPHLSPFPFPTPHSYRETKKPAAAPTPLPSHPCGKERVNRRG